ncbi:MAG TPA: 23S rRNA (guanosine(2251)-2'-O)-methyltransferase RlmB [Fluviicoccus sp.]|nr:23S rRNA (guanosine(2251)-2'-O)-methyltransferase RlmB [Fluviicoccus sp.]
MAKPELVYGIHTVEALLHQHPESVLEVFILLTRDDNRLHVIENLAKRHGISLQSTSRDKLDQMSGSPQHQGVAARTRPLPVQGDSELMTLVEGLQVPPLLLVLDNITDPHNLGACLRTAEAVGVHGVVAPKDRAAGLTPVARKTASGAAEVLPFFQVTNLARTLGQLAEAGVWRVGTTLTPEAKSLYEIKLTGPMAIVMGAEGAGMRRLTRENCDELAFIPMVGTVQSLNVSVATGITLYEAYRQRTR